MIRETMTYPLAIGWGRVAMLRGAAEAVRRESGTNPAQLRIADFIDELIDMIAQALIDRGEPFPFGGDQALLLPLTPDQCRTQREGGDWREVTT